MKMTGQERIAAPRSRVWQALNDPAVLQQCIPGCQSLQQESPDKLRATVEIKIGPIGARFNSVVTLTDVNAPQSYTLIGEGQGGTVGSAKAVIKVQLVEDGTATLLSYEVDAQVGGRLAQLGGPLIDATAKQLAAKFFRKFGEVVCGAKAAPVAAQTSPTSVAASAPASAGAAPSSASLPITWILALAVAALVGFLVGRAQGDATGSDWMGLAIGLLVIIVAAAGFEYGRRSATSQVVLDAALLERLLRNESRGDKQ